MGLISLHRGAVRKNGGIGFAIEAPTANLHIEKSTDFLFADKRSNPLADCEKEQLLRMMQDTSKECGLTTRVSVVLTGDLRTHFGMGSGTAIRLGILEALFRINGKNVERNKLVRHSRRGGTSGVGVNSYFTGGLVLDLGTENDEKFLPSSQSIGSSIPLTLPWIRMPDWPLCLCLPRSVTPKTQTDEVNFFGRAAPIEPRDSFEASYHILFGIYAAVIANDFAAFCTSIDVLQTTRWKRLEWSEYGEVLWQLKERIRNFGVNCVGMSSLGPMLYCFGTEGKMEKFRQAAEALECDFLLTRSRNTGRVLNEG